MQIKVETVCGFESQLGDDRVALTENEVAQIEQALDEWRRVAVPARANFTSTRWGVPSMVVRVDMAPLRVPGPHRHFLYEVEGGPGGLGFLAHLVGDEPFARLARILCGNGITELGWEIAPSRLRFEGDLGGGIAALGRSGLVMTTRGMNHGLPLLLRSSGEDEIPWERCLCDYSSGGGDKRSLEPFGAVLADEIENPEAAFPDGFALKPRRGTGTKDVHIWTPIRPYRDLSATRTKIAKLHAAARLEPGTWVIQPFYPPEWLPEERLCRIWRLFAAWDGTAYRVLGGVWNARRSLRVHGASDTVYGPVLAP